MKREDWIIEAENLCYTYEGNEEKALNGVDLKIRRGRKVAFLGGNGSGKSTFFLCLNGIRKPDQGRILIDGEPVKYTRKGLLEVRRKVGIVFQEPDDQLFSASVYQEISFGILNLGADEKTTEREVNRVIEELGITPFRDRPAHALSGGQKKLVAIADILVMHPEVMILDEPTAALDPVAEMEVYLNFDKIAGDKTAVYISHRLSSCKFCNEIAVFDHGQVVQQGTHDNLLKDMGKYQELWEAQAQYYTQPTIK